MLSHIVIGLLFVGVTYVQGRSDDEVRGWFFSLAIDCNKDYPIDAEELKMLYQHKIPDNAVAKCLMACVYKKTELMDDKGMYDLTKTNEWINKEFSDDATRLKNAKMLFDFCKTVNDESIKDEGNGCERAYHLSKCLTENHVKMGFEIK